MKKILITGAAGTIGVNLIKYLLSEGKYEITALDLKNNLAVKKLKKYRKRINIIYGDIFDRNLIEALVKDHNVIIHLITCLPPLSEYKKSLNEIIEYQAIENITRAISYYNPECHLIYASSTSLYGPKEGRVKQKINIDNNNYFNYNKYKSEELIKKKLDNYTIMRIPLIIGDLKQDKFIYSLDKEATIECMSKEDASYAFSKCIDNLNKINQKTLNIGGGSSCRCTYKELIINILKYHGLSLNYLFTRLFAVKNYTSPILLDSDESNKILNYRDDSLESIFMRQKRKSKNRKIALILSKPIVKIMERNQQ